jgi:hypothetical protein
VGFFRDLFGQSRPCDVCQLGKGSWPGGHSGVADWKVRGHGLSADFLICARCALALKDSGLMHGNPFVAMAALVRAGLVERPPTHAYLQHSEWRKVAIHSLETAGLATNDEFAALATLKAMEAQLFPSAVTSPSPVRVTHDRHEREWVDVQPADRKTYLQRLLDTGSPPEQKRARMLLDQSAHERQPFYRLWARLRALGRLLRGR